MLTAKIIFPSEVFTRNLTLDSVKDDLQKIKNCEPEYSMLWKEYQALRTLLNLIETIKLNDSYNLASLIVIYDLQFEKFENWLESIS